MEMDTSLGVGGHPGVWETVANENTSTSFSPNNNKAEGFVLIGEAELDDTMGLARRGRQQARLPYNNNNNNNNNNNKDNHSQEVLHPAWDDGLGFGVRFVVIPLHILFPGGTGDGHDSSGRFDNLPEPRVALDPLSFLRLCAERLQLEFHGVMECSPLPEGEEEVFLLDDSLEALGEVSSKREKVISLANEIVLDDIATGKEGRGGAVGLMGRDPPSSIQRYTFRVSSLSSSFTCFLDFLAALGSPTAPFISNPSTLQPLSCSQALSLFLHAIPPPPRRSTVRDSSEGLPTGGRSATATVTRTPHSHSDGLPTLPSPLPALTLVSLLALCASETDANERLRRDAYYEQELRAWEERDMGGKQPKSGGGGAHPPSHHHHHHHQHQQQPIFDTSDLIARLTNSAPYIPSKAYQPKPKRPFVRYPNTQFLRAALSALNSVCVDPQAMNHLCRTQIPLPKRAMPAWVETTLLSQLQLQQQQQQYQPYFFPAAVSTPELKTPPNTTSLLPILFHLLSLPLPIPVKAVAMSLLGKIALGGSFWAGCVAAGLEASQIIATIPPSVLAASMSQVFGKDAGFSNTPYSSLAVPGIRQASALTPVSATFPNRPCALDITGEHESVSVYFSLPSFSISLYI